MLDTETISASAKRRLPGLKVTGNLLITFTRTAGANAVLNGPFPTAHRRRSCRRIRRQGAGLGPTGSAGLRHRFRPGRLNWRTRSRPPGSRPTPGPPRPATPALQVPGLSNRVAAVWYAYQLHRRPQPGRRLDPRLRAVLDDWDSKCIAPDRAAQRRRAGQGAITRRSPRSRAACTWTGKCRATCSSRSRGRPGPMLSSTGCSSTGNRRQARFRPLPHPAPGPRLD